MPSHTDTISTHIPTLHLVADISGSMCELGQQSALSICVQSILRISSLLPLFKDVQLWTLGSRAERLSAAEWDGTFSCRGYSHPECLQDITREAQSGDCLLLLSDGSFNSELAHGLQGQLMELRCAALSIGPASDRSQLEHIVGKGNVFAAQDALPALYSLAAAGDFPPSSPNRPVSPAREEPAQADEDEW